MEKEKMSIGDEAYIPADAKLPHWEPLSVHLIGETYSDVLVPIRRKIAPEIAKAILQEAKVNPRNKTRRASHNQPLNLDAPRLPLCCNPRRKCRHKVLLPYRNVKCGRSRTN